jgi:hypothetical protein
MWKGKRKQNEEVKNENKMECMGDPGRKEMK